MKKGILLIASGHRNYFRMADVLAASIRVNNPGVSICIANDGNMQVDSKLYDRSVVIPSEYLTEPIKAKVYMYNLSPFDETLFLDVDQVMIYGRDISTVFEECKDLQFTMSNSGKAGTSVWVDIKEVQEKYGKDSMWNFHSELVYFKKCKEVQSYFKEVQKAYNNCPLKTAVKFAGGHMADELAFQIASITKNMYPHKENWCPNFWFDAHPKKSRLYAYQLTEFVTYSIGGKLIPQWVKNQYNTLAKAYFAKLGLSNPYQVEDKMKYLPERKNL